MTTVNYSVVDALIDNNAYTWAPLTTANADGQPAYYGGAGDRTVQVVGTFGVGGTVVLQGTLDNLNWFTLKDPSNASISFTAAGLRAVLEHVIAVRPYVSAGDGTTSITAILAVRKPRNG